MIRCCAAAVLCCTSISLAGASWGDARGPASDANDAASSAGEMCVTSDVGDVINAIVSAKAGRSVTRISAGLAGDWAGSDNGQYQKSASFTSATKRLDVKPSSLRHSRLRDEADATLRAINGMTDPTAADLRAAPTIAVAVPLPPAIVSAIPALVIAYIARRRFARD